MHRHSRFLYALLVTLAQAGCNGSDVRTPTEPLAPPPTTPDPVALPRYELSVLVTSGGHCLANARLQVVAPANAVSPEGLQTADFCINYDKGVFYYEPISFDFTLADDQWPVTVAASAAGYSGKRVEVSREQVQRNELLKIDLARQ